MLCLACYSRQAACVLYVAQDRPVVYVLCKSLRARPGSICRCAWCRRAAGAPFGKLEAPADWFGGLPAAHKETEGIAGLLMGLGACLLVIRASEGIGRLLIGLAGLSG